MADNKLSSINKYTVGNISRISTNTSIMKRPYDSTSSYPDKKDNNSKSFKRTLKSSLSKGSQTDEENDSSSLFANELNNRIILDSRETSRVINAKLNNTHSNKDNSNVKSGSPELHAKLRDAMKVEVDTSELYKKLQKLNTLK